MLLSLFLLAVLSLSQHKEDRFILPIYPLLILQIVKQLCRQPRLVLLAKWAGLLNLLMLLVVENVHKVGSVPALDYLRHMHHPAGSRILFLTPCH